MRFASLATFFTILFVVLVLNFYRLQVDKGFYYFQKAQARNDAAEELQLRRGQIFFTDKNNELIPVAMQNDYPAIYAVPQDISDIPGTAKKLSPLINMSEKDIIASLSVNPSGKFRLLVDKASPDMVNQVLSANVKGIYTDEKQYRFYPFETLGAHVVGYVGKNSESSDPIGLYGIEKLFNTTLAEGNNVQLTIDRNLQAEAEQMLDGLVKNFKAEGGSILIQDPHTGAILTLVNKPDFDPNNYGMYPIANFPNPAVQYVYEPGSVFKAFTMVAGIDTGAITPDTVYIDKGSDTLNGMTIRNWDLIAHGKMTMTQVIENSLNTGAIFAEQKTGDQTFLSYLKKFGFGQKTGIDLPDEVNGSLNNLEKKQTYAIDFGTAAYGQGVSVTPVQVITAFSAIANGGLLMKPYIVASDKPTVVRRVMSEDTSQKVSQMLQDAVENAHIAAIPHYRVAGKTGTAQIPENGGYSTNTFIHTFIGFLPVSNPKVVILIKLIRPDAELAGLSVVPAFHDLASFAVNYYNIPPDKPLGQQ